MQTNQFRSFKNRYIKEQEKRRKLDDYLRHFIEENESIAPSLTMPLTINEKTLARVSGTENNTDPFNRYSYYSLGKVEMDGFGLFLFFQEKPATYQYILLIGATIKEGSIIDVKPLALYKKNLVEEMNSRLSLISEKQIELQINYDKSYPVAQEIKSVYNFPVTENGRIIVTNTYGFDTLVMIDIRQKSPFK